MRTRWACSINFCELRRVEWTNTEQINVLRPVSPLSLVVSIQARRDAQTEYLYYLQLYCRNTPRARGVAAANLGSAPQSSARTKISQWGGGIEQALPQVCRYRYVICRAQATYKYILPAQWVL